MHSYPKVPFKKGGRVTDGYTSDHRANDVVPRNDDKGDVFAIEPGTVTDTASGKKPGDENSNMVIVKAVDSNITVYGHVNPSVIAGASISKGDKIGRVDLSGTSSGRHVHLVRLPPGGSTVDEILDRQDEGVAFTFGDLNPW